MDDHNIYAAQLHVDPHNKLGLAWQRGLHVLNLGRWPGSGRRVFYVQLAHAFYTLYMLWYMALGSLALYGFQVEKMGTVREKHEIM